MANTTNSNIKILKINDVMEILGCGRDTVNKIMSLPGFPSTKIGRSYIVQEDEFKRWLTANRGKTIRI